ncbi:MAG TPA: hypothetical protein VKP65_06955 [Rhodothermales bacterium]|nr:hypothetical protein [Rhodothermales bacterium]
MSAAAEVLKTLHLILQTGFLAVTFLLLLVTIVNRMRVRCVRLSWQRGPFRGLPLWPALFLSAVLLFFGSAYATGREPEIVIFIGYLMGGVCWFSASLLSASTLVTEYGLLEHVNRADRAVAWSQVVDYFEMAQGNQQRFVFFYLDHTDTRRRLELSVPRSRYAPFARLVREKIDARFNRSAQQVYGKKALEG